VFFFWNFELITLQKAARLFKIPLLSSMEKIAANDFRKTESEGMMAKLKYPFRKAKCQRARKMSNVKERQEDIYESDRKCEGGVQKKIER